MMNSFRNGPIKIVSSNQQPQPSQAVTSSYGFQKSESSSKLNGGHIGGSSSKVTATIGSAGSSSAAPNKSGQVRPSSAPTKRPSSPNQNNHVGSSMTTASAVNRTKYSKLKIQIKKESLYFLRHHYLKLN